LRRRSFKLFEARVDSVAAQLNRQYGRATAQAVAEVVLSGLLGYF
jgi:hypothetical protein